MAPEPAPFRRVRVRPVLDLAITVALGAPTTAISLWVIPAVPNADVTPGSTPAVERIDRVALDRFSPPHDIASDVTAAVSVVGPIAYLGAAAALQRRGWGNVRGRGFLVRFTTDMVIVAQTMAANVFVTQLFKLAARRPRPFAYIDPDEIDATLRGELVEAQSSTSVDRSFPSGHTSSAFAATTAGATLLTLELLGRNRAAIALAWVGGLGVATTTAVLRVGAGRHFTSDVLAGAAIGLGVGAAIPLAHWRPPRAGDLAPIARRLPSIRLVPRVSRTFAGASLVFGPIQR